jgi:hypothetical protein
VRTGFLRQKFASEKTKQVSGPIAGLRERSARDLLATLVADGILGPRYAERPDLSALSAA